MLAIIKKLFLFIEIRSVLDKPIYYCRDPNKPTALPSGIPEWPQFNTASNYFMELNSNGTKVITTPYKERLEKIVENIFSARLKQMSVDKGKAILSFPQLDLQTDTNRLQNIFKKFKEKQ